MRAVKGSSAVLLKRGVGNWKAHAWLMARSGKSIAKQSEGRAGETDTRSGGY